MAEQESGTDDLQFDQAEYEESSGQLTCGVCDTEIYSTYFEVNGNPSCERCRYRVEEELSSGSGTGRFLRALVAGVAAGAVGSGIYYAIAKLTGYEIGLVAIVVGLMVGFAVKWGCNGRGGWLYQGLAMLLTYLAIVTTYIPGVIEGLKEGYEGQEQPQAATQDAGDETTVDAVYESQPEVLEPAADEPETEPEITAGDRIFAYLVVFVIAFLAPFLLIFESPIGLVIVGIGLYEAWRINKRLVLEINGPFQVGQARHVPVADAE